MSALHGKLPVVDPPDVPEQRIFGDYDTNDGNEPIHNRRVLLLQQRLANYLYDNWICAESDASSASIDRVR